MERLLGGEGTSSFVATDALRAVGASGGMALSGGALTFLKGTARFNKPGEETSALHKVGEMGGAAVVERVSMLPPDAFTLAEAKGLR
jgi:hypothetical protein